jgi:predicted CDP-diglyceride synthetase/phosphatidate cytidylyltransferase
MKSNFFKYLSVFGCLACFSVLCLQKPHRLHFNQNISSGWSDIITVWHSSHITAITTLSHALRLATNG